MSSSLNQDLCKMIAQVPKPTSSASCCICFENNKDLYVTCPHCGHVFHLLCLVKWSEFSNIGCQVFLGAVYALTCLSWIKI